MGDILNDCDYHEAEAEGFDIGPVERVEHHLGALQSAAGLVVALGLIVAAVAFFAVDLVSLGIVAVAVVVFAGWVVWQSGKVGVAFDDAAEEARLRALAAEASAEVARGEAELAESRSRTAAAIAHAEQAGRAASAGADLDEPDLSDQ